MASAPSTLTVPFLLTVDVHAVEGGGFYGEVRDLPGCLAQADSLDGLAEAVREAVRDYFAEPGAQTEQTARELAAIQGAAAIPPGPYPLRRGYRPPDWWTEAHEDA
jgi:predicted RNase H-like HicB family nuclease